MNDLTVRERELVALGAAMGSNCVPCIQHHIPEARKAGLTDRQLSTVIRVADRVRQVPARKVLDSALGMLNEPAPEGTAGSCDASERAAPVHRANACCD